MTNKFKTALIFFLFTLFTTNAALAKTKTNISDVVIEGLSCDELGMFLTGLLRNKTDKELAGKTLAISIFDDKNKSQQCLPQIISIGKKSKKEFKIMCPCTDYTLESAIIN